ncbi:unnamed protein product [Ilex paraguariensis]|uniref:Uncharacterized protein n=1 Tax=Ilex paraguariensis TaxID=185542 RepID=A0ABC8QYU7_9AQUA
MHNFLDDIDNFQEQTLKIFLDMGFDSFMLVFPNAEQNEKDIAIYVEGGFEISTKGNFKKVLAKKDPEGFFKGLKGLSRDRRPKVFPASEPSELSAVNGFFKGLKGLSRDRRPKVFPASEPSELSAVNVAKIQEHYKFPNKSMAELPPSTIQYNTLILDKTILGRDGSPELIFDFASPLKGWCRRFFFVSGRAWEFDKGDLFDIRRDGSPKLIFDFASPLKGWCRRFFFVSGRAWEFDKGDLFDIRVPLMSTVPGI